MSTLSGSLPCAQTPLQYPNMDSTFTPSAIISSVNNYGNAGLRLWSILPGSGRAFPSYDNTNGVQVDENIQCTLTVNSVQCTLFDMRIYNAAHRVFNTVDISGQLIGTYTSPYTTAVLEAYIFFKDNLNNIYALVLPIGIDDSKTNTYASKYIGGLTNTSDGNSNQPTLSTLFQDLSGATPSGSFNATNPILQYTGQDVRKMNCNDKTITLNPITYLVAMNDMKSTKLLSTTITTNQLNTFLTMFTNIDLNIQNSPSPIGQSAITNNEIRYIPGGTFYITNSRSGSGPGPSNISTSALKCYPVDPSKDIKNGQLYLDANGVPIPFPTDSSTTGISLSPVASSFWSSSAGIESMIAIAIAGILVIIAIYFLGMSWFSKKEDAINIAVKKAIAGSVSTNIATGPATTIAGISFASISSYSIIALAIFATISFGAAITFSLLYYGVISK